MIIFTLLVLGLGLDIGSLLVGISHINHYGVGQGPANPLQILLLLAALIFGGLGALLYNQSE